jgi:hypothetical protein
MKHKKKLFLLSLQLNQPFMIELWLLRFVMKDFSSCVFVVRLPGQIGKGQVENISVVHFFSGTPPGLRTHNSGPINILLFSQLSNYGGMRKSCTIAIISGPTMKNLPTIRHDST